MDGDVLSAILQTPAPGWSAFGVIAVYVIQSIARGTWVPEKAHHREIAIITESRDEWRKTSQEARKTIAILIASQGITEDFFRKVSVNPESQAHLDSLVQIAMAEAPDDEQAT